jgi:hypothetical protein
MKSYSEFLNEGSSISDKKIAKVASVAAKYGYEMTYGNYSEKKREYSFVVEDDRGRNNDDYVIRVLFDASVKKFRCVITCNYDSVFDEKTLKKFNDFVTDTYNMLNVLNRLSYEVLALR